MEGGSATRVPTFLLVGAPKCGTTSLAHYLGQHPDVFFSEPKEPIFFEAEYEKGLEYYWRTYYRAWHGESAIGEGRVWNLYLPFVPLRIRESVPEARLIALLRDPVERAYSHWWHRHSRGQEPLGFGAAVAADRARIERGEGFEGEEGARRWRAGLEGAGQSTSFRVLLDLGFYAEQLGRYLDLFPASRLHVILRGDVITDLPGVMRRLFAFLGVSEDAPLRDASPRNVRAARVRSSGARRLLLATRSLGLRHLVPRALRPRLRTGWLEHAGEQPPMPPGIRRALVEYYEPHTRRLERLLDRDLGAWRDPAER